MDTFLSISYMSDHQILPPPHKQKPEFVCGLLCVGRPWIHSENLGNENRARRKLLARPSQTQRTQGGALYAARPSPPHRPIFKCAIFIFECRFLKNVCYTTNSNVEFPILEMRNGLNFCGICFGPFSLKLTGGPFLSCSGCARCVRGAREAAILK